MKNNRYLVTLIVYGTAILLLMLVQVLFSLGCFDALSYYGSTSVCHQLSL